MVHTIVFKSLKPGALLRPQVVIKTPDWKTFTSERLIRALNLPIKCTCSWDIDVEKFRQNPMSNHHIVALWMNEDRPWSWADISNFDRTAIQVVTTFRPSYNYIENKRT